MTTLKSRNANLNTTCHKLVLRPILTLSSLWNTTETGDIDNGNKGWVSSHKGMLIKVQYLHHNRVSVWVVELWQKTFKLNSAKMCLSQIIL